MRKIFNNFKNREEGFTLVEIVVAIGILISLTTAGLYGYPTYVDWKNGKEVEIATTYAYDSALNALENPWSGLTIESAVQKIQESYPDVILEASGLVSTTLCVEGVYITDERLKYSRGSCESESGVPDTGGDLTPESPEPSETPGTPTNTESPAPEETVEETPAPEPTETETNQPSPTAEPTATSEPSSSPTPTDPETTSPSPKPVPEIGKTSTFVFECEVETTGRLPLYKISNGFILMEGSDNSSNLVGWDDEELNYTNTVTMKANVEYSITFSGMVLEVRNTDGPNGLVKCLETVGEFGKNSGIERVSFSGAEDLTNIPKNLPSTVVNLEAAFENVSNFNDGDVSSWDVSNVTTMKDMFKGASSFNKSLNGWDTSSVEDFSGMFDGAANFNQNVRDWDVSGALDMSNMFRNAVSFNQVMNNWNMSNAVNLSGMFYGASSVNMPMNNWDTSNVTDMSYMFYGASSFDKPLQNWNTSKVTDMTSMFQNSSMSKQLKKWNVEKVTNYSNFAPHMKKNALPSFK